MSSPPEAEVPRDPARKAVRMLLSNGVSTGELAELRRSEADRVPGPAFWRVMASVLDRPVGLDEQPAWSCALQGLAELRGVAKENGLQLGAALAEAQFAESRLVRLLRADGTFLFRELRTAAHFLAQKGVSVNPIDLVRLALTPPAFDPDEVLRRRIAQSYYRHAHASHTDNQES